MNQEYGKVKGKECSPSDTISAIEKILLDLGIIVLQEWNSPIKNSFSVLLRIKGTNLFTNGKGTTEEYALASGYAEMMERLQTMALFRFHLQYPDDVMYHSNFVYAPDEIKATPEEMINRCNKFIPIETGIELTERLQVLEEWLHIENSQFSTNNSSDVIYSIPFKEIISGNEVFFPIKMLDLLYGSNGMCAGNKYEEAMVQGLSELCERFANKTIIKDRLSVPTIGIEYIKEHCPTSYNIIQAVHQHHYKIIVKDCSLGIKYPVVAIICIDKRIGKYFVKFGAQPNLDIAIERCLTEMFQGRDLKNVHWLKEFFYSYSNDFINKNLSSILHTGDGFYPYEFFLDSKEPFAAWCYQGNDNKKFFEELTQLITDNGYKIYVRDWSFLSFPTYQIVIPGFSNIYDSIKERIHWHSKYLQVKRYVKALDQLDKEKFDAIMGFMELNGYNNGYGILELLGLPVNRSGKWSILKKDYFAALYYFYQKDYPKAYEYMNSYVQYSNNSITRCLRQYMVLKLLKKDSIDIATELKDYYSPEVISHVTSVLDKSYFDQYSTNCFECTDCREADCNQNNINNYLKVIKDKYLAVSIY